MIRFKNTFYCFLSLFFAIGKIAAVTDPLPSWNEGQAKTAIIEFVKNVTQEGPSYISPKDRIATFDEDGTLWIEQPLYIEYIFTLESYKALEPQHPEWNKEPFKLLLSGDAAEAIKNFSTHDVERLIALTHSGITIDAFHKRVQDWLKAAIHPRYKRPYTELVFQPMMEVMQLFRDNQFQVYIVSGGGQEFMRSFTENLYDLPPSHIIGTTGKVKYKYQDGHLSLLKLPEIMYIDDKQGKPEGINLMIGKRPVAAFGNSTGDKQMLEWTQANKGKTLELLVHHDDAEREYDYGANSKIGTFSDSLMDEALKNKWIVVSMKNDWKIVFAWQKTTSSCE